MRIGVFDSGIGGKSVAQAVKQQFPAAEVVFVNDSQNVPYGTKSPELLLELVSPIIQKMAKHVDVIVLACNTVSTTLAPQLRELVTTPIVALEPMVKPAAAMTQTGVIAVCATPTTLASARYQWLKDEFAVGVEVLEPDCSEWSSLIEADKISQHHISEQIDLVCEKGADVVVLGCTHYHWIEALIKQVTAERATVLQPEQPVIAQLARVLAQLD